jgi:carotenoid cleavage dioxygenase
MATMETLIRASVTKGIEGLAAFNRRLLASSRGPQPYLTGLHRPMTDEVSLEALETTGTLPAALAGLYLRIGPNPAEARPIGYHWFTGDGMVHGLRIKDGRAVWYRNRWIRSKAVAAAVGVAAAPGPRAEGPDTVNTNIMAVAGRIFALNEAGAYPVELSADLDHQCYNPFDGTLHGAITAHPHLDPETGERHGVCYQGGVVNQIRHVVIDPSGRVVREEPITVSDGPSIHDSALTRRYIVILDLPVTFSMTSLIAGRRFPYGWSALHAPRIGLLPRGGADADVIWCPVDPAYVFHVANAFDCEDGRVAIDVCAYETMFATASQGPDGRPRGLERWLVDPISRRVEIKSLDPAPQEFPRADERLWGRPYRYLYTLALPPDTTKGHLAATAIHRHDLETGSRGTRDFGPGRHPGEFVFVPKSPDAAEDDGWLMGLVVDANVERTEFVVLDARAFNGEPQAVVHLPHRIPLGFHAAWIPDPAQEPVAAPGL